MCQGLNSHYLFHIIGDKLINRKIVGVYIPIAPGFPSFFGGMSEHPQYKELIDLGTSVSFLEGTKVPNCWFLASTKDARVDGQCLPKVGLREGALMAGISVR